MQKYPEPFPDNMPHEILVHATELLRTPGAWTQRAFARDVSGKFVSPVSQHPYHNAVQFDITGAITHQMINRFLMMNEPEDGSRANRILGNVYKAIMVQLQVYLPGRFITITEFNDHPKTDAALVLLVMEKARDWCEANPPTFTPKVKK